MTFGWTVRVQCDAYANYPFYHPYLLFSLFILILYPPLGTLSTGANCVIEPLAKTGYDTAEIEELIDRDTAGHSGRYQLNSDSMEVDTYILLFPDPHKRERYSLQRDDYISICAYGAKRPRNVISNNIRKSENWLVFVFLLSIGAGPGQRAINTMTIRVGESLGTLVSGKPCRGPPMPEAQAYEHSSGERRQ